jgi:hypothetical protein
MRELAAMAGRRGVEAFTTSSMEGVGPAASVMTWSWAIFPTRAWLTNIKDRLEESQTLQQQAQNNSLAQFSASPDLHSEFLSAHRAMDSSADLSAQILNSPDLSQKLLAELVPIIYKGLKATA